MKTLLGVMVFTLTLVGMAHSASIVQKVPAPGLPPEFYEVWAGDASGNSGSLQKISPILRDIPSPGDPNVKEPHVANITDGPDGLKSWSITPEVWTR